MTSQYNASPLDLANTKPSREDLQPPQCFFLWGYVVSRSGQVRSGSASYHRPLAREMRPTARRLAEHTHTEHGESLQVQTEPRRPEGAPAGR